MQSFTAALAVLLLASCAPAERAEPKRVQFENLVFILIDTLRSDHLPSYGYERQTAPFLTRLANQGIQLQGYSVSSFTRTSVATLLTGLYPQRHQTYSGYDHLPAQVPFLPVALEQAGFDTAAYVANPSVSETFGFGRGYRNFRSFHGKKGRPRGDPNAPNDDPALLAPNKAVKRKVHASVVTDNGLALAKDLKPPFFLYLHYLDPHAPYSPERAWGGATGPVVQPRDVKQGKAVLSAENLAMMRDLYDGAILEMDVEIERLMKELDAAGLLENTLVVVTADHGEEFGEHGGTGHGRTLHEEVVQVPLILWSKRGLAPQRSSVGFHQVDLAPTLLEALGVPRPAGTDGESRWADIVEGKVAPRDEYVFLLEHKDRASIALTRPPYKLIHQRKTPSNLLYDLRKDPAEGQNLAKEEDVRARMLRRLVERHNELSREEFERVAAPIAPAVRAHLEALGYVQPASAATPERLIPEELHVNDDRVEGLFAGSAPDHLANALNPSARSEQLLGGWGERDENGRWSEPQASFVLRRPPEASSLVLEGKAPPDASELDVALTVNGAPAGVHKIRPGSFKLVVPLPEAARNQSLLYVDLRVVPRKDPVKGVLWSRLAAR